MTVSERKAQQLQAYDLTHAVVTALCRSGKLPPAFLLGSEELQDLVGDVYAYVLPLVDKYDPARGKLSTYLYRYIKGIAVQIACREARRGIIGTGAVIHYSDMPNDEDDDYSDDGLYTAFVAGVPADEYVRRFTYSDPPRGFEIPGSEQLEHREQRDADTAAVNSWLEELPGNAAEAVRARWDGADGEAADVSKFDEKTDTWYIAARLRRLLAAKHGA